MRIHTLHLHLGLADELGMHIVCTVLCKIWIGMWFMVCATRLMVSVRWHATAFPIVYEISRSRIVMIFCEAVYEMI